MSAMFATGAIAEHEPGSRSTNGEERELLQRAAPTSNLSFSVSQREPLQSCPSCRRVVAPGLAQLMHLRASSAPREAVPPPAPWRGYFLCSPIHPSRAFRRPTLAIGEPASDTGSCSASNQGTFSAMIEGQLARRSAFPHVARSYFLTKDVPLEPSRPPFARFVDDGLCTLFVMLRRLQCQPRFGRGGRGNQRGNFG